MKPIFQSNARSRRHRQAQSPEPQTEQTPFFAAADQHEVQTKPQPFFQAKAAGVKIGQPNDVYEQEADAVADKVVNGQTAHSTNGGAAAGVQRLPITPLGSGSLQRLSTPEEDKMPGTNDARMAQDKEIQEKPEAGSPMLQKMDAPKEEEKPVQKMGEKEEEPVQAKEEEEQPVQKMDAPKEEEKPLQKMGEKEEEPVQTKEEEEQPVQAKASTGAQNASPNLGARLSQKKGSGNPLPKSVRAEMEQGIGADFSGVRIHTDNDAVDMNKEVHAQAFTHGQDVYFNSGKFNPEQTEGKRLLAHELTHVVQQGGAQNSIQRATTSTREEERSDRRSDRRESRGQESDRRRRRPEGGDGSGGHLDSDWAGRAILHRYLLGLGDWHIRNDSNWSAYMKANAKLKQILKPVVLAAAQETLKNSFYIKGIFKQFPAEIENGESIVGYQYLHGTDANVGGFQTIGYATREEFSKTISKITLNLSFIWNDIIDPNPKYKTDNIKSTFAEIITLGQADPYSIHIQWNEKITVYLTNDGKVISFAGYPLT